MSRSVPIPARIPVAALCLALLISPLPARAESQIERQERMLLEQERVIEEQRQMLARQEALLEQLLRGPGILTPDAELELRTGRGEPEGAPAAMIAPEPVGQAPEEDDTAPEIAALGDVGGLLTPRGTLVLEPQFQFGSTAINRFSFGGIGFTGSEGVLIGNLNASDSDRDAMVASLTARYGITSRLELEAKIPYVMRDDRISRTIVNQDGTSSAVSELDGSGFGDVELGLRYQFASAGPENGLPFLVANLRVKSATGSHPFKVRRDDVGVPVQLATGSGFWTVEPSLTAMIQSDPAVFFGNVNYAWNMGDRVGRTIPANGGSVRIGKIEPGDVVGASFGMSLGLNEQSSFSLAYDHRYVRPSLAEFSGRGIETESLQVGSFIFGLNYRTRRGTPYSLQLSFGATQDAPDMQLSLRAPMNFDLF